MRRVMAVHEARLPINSSYGVGAVSVPPMSVGSSAAKVCDRAVIDVWKPVPSDASRIRRLMPSSLSARQLLEQRDLSAVIGEVLDETEHRLLVGHAGAERRVTRVADLVVPPA